MAIVKSIATLEKDYEKEWAIDPKCESHYIPVWELTKHPCSRKAEEMGDLETGDLELLKW